MKFLFCSVLLTFLFFSIASADQVESLIGAINDSAEQPETKLAAIQVLGDIGDDRAVPVLSEQVKSSDPETRFLAIKSLGKIGTPPAREALLELEQAGDSEQQNGALIALAMAKDPQAKKLAEAGLQSPSWMSRWYSVLALDILGDPAATPLLEAALIDPYQLPGGGRFPIRESAQAALDRLKTSMHWSYSLNEGMEKAGLENKPLLLYFYINGGEWCEQFERETFTKEAIQKLAAQFVPVKINAYAESGLSEQYGIAGTPTLLILDQQGTELSRLPGYVAPDRVQSYLEEAVPALTDKGGKAELWIKAQGLIDQGHYEEAIPVLESFLSGDLSRDLAGKEEWARFMLALAYGKKENHVRARELFEQFIQKFPNSELMDKALYCLALAKLHLSYWDSARQTLTDLLAKYPQSPVVKQAQELLNQLLEIS